MEEKPKIIVCGDVEGKFKQFVTRIQNVNKKHGPFEFVLCVGNFFGSTNDSLEPYKNGTLKVPVQTYVLGPNVPDHVALYPDITGCELCPNVNYLGKRGVLTLSSGLKLAYLSGVQSSSNQPDDHCFTTEDVDALSNVCTRGKANYRGIDILLTSPWPRDIVIGERDRAVTGNSRDPSILSWLAAKVKPRYHFSGLKGIHYQRVPYRNHSKSGDTAEHLTYFVALAKVGNSDKQKWLLALNMAPIDSMKPSELYEQTTDETLTPYSGCMLAPEIPSGKQQKPSQYFFDMESPEPNTSNQRKKAKHEHNEPRSRPVFDQETCWFCLSSPQVEKQLVISIGSEVYLALAKGGMVPDHVLILPVGHHQSLAEVPDSVRSEIKRFKSALKKFFKTKNKVPVFFERNYKTSHLQIQVVPVPSELSPKLKMVFEEFAEQDEVQLDELPPHAELSQIAPPRTPYFYVELPSGERFYHRVRKSFPLQFGREVLASEDILNMSDRADWKDCKTSKEDEVQMAKKFRSQFQQFDFTL